MASREISETSGKVSLTWDAHCLDNSFDIVFLVPSYSNPPSYWAGKLSVLMKVLLLSYQVKLQAVIS